jgi:hypothetical protein
MKKVKQRGKSKNPEKRADQQKPNNMSGQGAVGKYFETTEDCAWASSVEITHHSS